MVSDMRILSSDLSGEKQLSIPARQVGSSIMPGKINPVIPEFVVSSAHKIYTNDALISSLAGQGNLELNPYVPVVGHALLESLKLLIAIDQTLMDNMLKGIRVHSHTALRRLHHSPSVTTALSPYIGYHRAADLAKTMKQEQIDVFEANRKLEYLEEERLKALLEPANLLKMGFRIDELMQ